MDRPQKLITVVILAVFLLLGGCSADVEPPVVVVPFFPDLHGYDLKQLTISDAETTLDFKRVDCVWVVGDDNRPSDEPRVTALADALVTLAPQLEPAIGPERYRDFRVAEDSFSRRVVLTFKDKSTFILLIGMPALTKPAYIRAADANQVYKVDVPLLRQINLDGNSWFAPGEG